MKRRSLLKGLALGIAMTYQGRRSRAQQSTPSPSGGADSGSRIPPIRWTLASIDTTDDALIPDDPTRYTVQFLDGGLVLIGADCNSASGTYRIDDAGIAIGDIITTLMKCSDDSLDSEFLAALQSASAFAISQDASDQLALATGPDGMQALFAASLPGVTWQWDITTIAGIDMPESPERYTLEFRDDGSVTVQADCNNGRGDAEIDGNQISLTVATTRRACAAGSGYGDFMQILSDASSFTIRDGLLHLIVPEGAGEAIFRPIPSERPEPEATPPVL